MVIATRGFVSCAMVQRWRQHSTPTPAILEFSNVWTSFRSGSPALRKANLTRNGATS